MEALWWLLIAYVVTVVISFPLLLWEHLVMLNWDLTIGDLSEISIRSILPMLNMYASLVVLEDILKPISNIVLIRRNK